MHDAEAYLAELHATKSMAIVFRAIQQKWKKIEFYNKMLKVEHDKALEIIRVFKGPAGQNALTGRGKEVVREVEDFWQSFQMDSSMIAGEDLKKGGIDFNSNMMNLNEEGQAMEFKFSNGDLNISPDAIQRVLPVIINITPVTNLPLLLGMTGEASDQKLSSL